MDIDEDGRLFVLEMPGYPLDTRPTGRVKVLEDRDGDGRYETSAVFADGLVLPTGIMRWKKGVLVTSAPDVWYLEDTDGDGRPTSGTVITGFAFTNPQHMVNGPVYGLDNWIYLAHEGPAEAVIYQGGLRRSGSPLRCAAKPDRPARAEHRQRRPAAAGHRRPRAACGRLAIRPRLRRVGALLHPRQLESRAPRGDRRALSRCAIPICSSSRRDGRTSRTTAERESVSRLPTGRAFELLTEPGQFTSACAITPYTGGAFPEPGGGRRSSWRSPCRISCIATFWSGRARRSWRAARRRVASSWLRPTAGSGRCFSTSVPTARSMSSTTTARGSNIPSGPRATCRRIRRHSMRDRIAAASTGSARDGMTPGAPPALGRADTATLVNTLEKASLWWRRTAQRLLLDRHPQDAVPLLTKLATSSSSAARTVTRALDAGRPWRARRAAHPGRARRHRGRRPRECDSAGRAAAERVASIGLGAGRHDRRLQSTRALQCARGARISRFTQAADARDRLLRNGIEDAWTRIAALSAGSNRTLALFDRMTADTSTPSSPGRQASSSRRHPSLRPGSVRRKCARSSSVPPRHRPRRGGAGRRWPVWRVVREDTSALGNCWARCVLHCVALFGDPRSEVRRGALELLQLAGPGADAAWRTAMSDALARAGRRTEDADRRADAVPSWPSRSPNAGCSGSKG